MIFFNNDSFNPNGIFKIFFKKKMMNYLIVFFLKKKFDFYIDRVRRIKKRTWQPNKGKRYLN